MKAATEPVVESSHADTLYKLDDRTRELLVESAPLMAKWSRTACDAKATGGMEEWAKTQGGGATPPAGSCDWYHGTWQYLRLLNMVATPPWYPFYSRALGTQLRKRSSPSVLISAAADWGMLATLHQAIQWSGAAATITMYDICNTPLLASQWYAERHGLEVKTVCDNLLTSATVPRGAFDVIVTDEFLTVLKAADKPLITKRWRELLAPGGVVVTTAMVGTPTTPEQRRHYADRARRLLKANGDVFRRLGVGTDELLTRFDHFAAFHTRHMVTGVEEVRRLFSDFYLGFCVSTPTPGECVNPTHSFQILASVPFVRSA